jgi:hypothetical protein
MAGIHGSLQATGSSDIAAIYGAILVTKPSELAPALAQHVAPVVIASTRTRTSRKSSLASLAGRSPDGGSLHSWSTSFSPWLSLWNTT